MDKHFLEFWGNFLLAAARGQRQVDEFSRWMSQGMSGVADLTAMFRHVYGLGSDSPADGETWKTACNSFEKAYRTYLDTLGVVPQSDYLALKKQLEEMQKKAEEQEATLRKLRLELSGSRMAQGDAVHGFQELIQVQSEQFQALTDSFSRFFAGGTDKASAEKP